LGSHKIATAAINYPGSWHDATVCQDLVNWAITFLRTYCLCVDQGFPRSGDLKGKFVGPLSRKSRLKLSPILANSLLRRHALYTSLRQASEWGMRALQGTFSRLKSRLTSDKTKRSMLIHSIVYLHNFRTEMMGLNQIAAVFNPEYQQYVNFVNYDRIARYF
jgi:hypothetical protein